MSRTSRIARALVPRFGILWMAAAMLLVVSAAGWWKFHRDLYVEECAVVEALKLAEQTGPLHSQKVAVHRFDPQFFVGSGEEADTSVPWNAPLLEPIQMLFIQGAPTAEARNAALRLPRLKAYGEHQFPPRQLPGDWKGIETFLGRPLPERPEETLSVADLDEPLPEGDDVDAAEAERIAAAIRDAWQNAGAIPARRLVVREAKDIGEAPIGYGMNSLRVDVMQPGKAFRWSQDQGRRGDEGATLLLGDSVCGFGLHGEQWLRSSRRVDETDRDEMRLFRRHPDDEFPYLTPDFNGDGIVGNWMREHDDAYRFVRIARIDDVRYRVDFSPFEVPDAQYDNHVGPPEIPEWQCVLRSDFGWAPEASRIVQIWPSIGNPPTHEERRMVQRFHRVGEFVTLAERLTRDTTARGGAAPVVRETLHSRYTTEIDPELDERVFDPLALDPEPWPERRELPWLRWYRVTFGLGCGLALFLVGRKFVSVSPRREVPTESETPGDDAKPEAAA